MILWIGSVNEPFEGADVRKGTGLNKRNDDRININNGVSVGKLIHWIISRYKTCYARAAKMDQDAPLALQTHVTYLFTRRRRTFLLKSTAVD